MKRLVLLSIVSFLATSPVFAQSVDLLWQGNGYVPPFYQGRTIWSKQTKITLLVIPHGLGSSANLNYKWTKTGTVLGNASGIGRNSLIFIDNILSKPQTFKVEIIAGDETVVASASVDVTPSSPSLSVYEDSPLYGFTFHQEVGSAYQMKEKEATFAAFPFFFGIKDRADGAIEYGWRANAGEVETRNSVTYRAPDGTSGSAEVSASATHKEKITQDARKSFLIQFGKENE
ncbi:MAG: hypothetical protein AAB641_01340 [Patescibacteria group bacterium]